MSFNFTNLQAFENRMNQNGVNVAFFSVTYGVNNCEVECAYSIIQKKFIFGFVDVNIGFTCNLQGTSTDTRLSAEVSTQLANCRDGSRDWRPSHFFDILNQQLTNVNFSEITSIQYGRVYQSATNFEDRIFFNHWRQSSMSDKQKEKTIELLGIEVLNYCNTNGIIPIFHATPSQRTLDIATNHFTDHGTHGTNQ